MKAAKENQIKKDYYIFNRRLIPAISLYEKFGFGKCQMIAFTKPILKWKINLQ
jgi:hypothetical protein